jgi:hypothetical protein
VGVCAYTPPFFYLRVLIANERRERPDVALVGLGLSSEHALDLITEMVREASCPVIALLTAKDPAYVREAARRLRLHRGRRRCRASERAESDR